MGYTIHDWFQDQALPALSTAFERMKEKQDDECDSSFEIFMKAIEEIFSRDDYNNVKKDDFMCALVLAMTKNETDIFKTMRTVFNYLACDDDKELISIEYRAGQDKVRCDYNSLNQDDE